MMKQINNWIHRKLHPNELKLYRIRVINPERTDWVWHSVLASNKKEALLMRTYINDEGWEA